MIAVLMALMLVASTPDSRAHAILEKRCVPCHNSELKNGGVSFLDRESLLTGGSRGPAVVPGKPESSLMIAALRHEGELQMPPGPKLPAKEIRVLTEWVKRGAVRGPSGKDRGERKSFGGATSTSSPQ